MKDFFGNPAARQTLLQMVESGRIPQTLLLHGPEGVGKATLVRRFATQVLAGDPSQIEADDLSRPENVALIQEREKWPADKRNGDPLLFSSHPDFVTFAPDGPLRQISIQQMRSLKERAQFRPLQGSRRLFLIDQIDRANEQAANSLLKILEEPPAYLIVAMTAVHLHDLLPTIRSRVVPIHLRLLDGDEMQSFAASQKFDDPSRRLALAGGSPGVASRLDLAAYDRWRGAMLLLLQAASGCIPFGHWIKQAESLGSSKSERLENYLAILALLLEDVLLLQHGQTTATRNADIHPALAEISSQVSFSWLRTAVQRVDELAGLLRRNIQRTIALDALVMELRALALVAGTRTV